MPFLVKHLIQGHEEPVTTTPDATVQQALDVMIARDYSQLPVVDPGGRPRGVITADSILRTLSNFGVAIEALHVADALTRARIYRDDDDLFDVLNSVRDDYAVLIVDDERRLRGIVTSYDTTAYFRRRAQDMMVVEDIETVLKHMIQAVFAVQDGAGDEQLSVAIADVDANADLRKQFGKALAQYLNVAGKADGSLNQELVDTVFSTHFGRKAPTKTLGDLSFGELVDLLLHKSKAEHVKAIFQLEPKAIRTLLHGVRDTRNTLAHFRGDIAPKQRDQLHFCIAWLTERQKQLVAVASDEAASTGRTDADAVVSIDRATNRHRGTAAGEGRYEPLVQHLATQPDDREAIGLTFTQIESIIGDKLPESAREHPSWWDNNPGAYPAQLWLDAGWRKAHLDIAGEQVSFARLKGFRTLQGA